MTTRLPSWEVASTRLPSLEVVSTRLPSLEVVIADQQSQIAERTSISRVEGWAGPSFGVLAEHQRAGATRADPSGV